MSGTLPASFGHRVARRGRELTRQRATSGPEQSCTPTLFGTTTRRSGDSPDGFAAFISFTHTSLAALRICVPWQHLPASHAAPPNVILIADLLASSDGNCTWVKPRPRARAARPGLHCGPACRKPVPPCRTAAMAWWQTATDIGHLGTSTPKPFEFPVARGTR